jgi:PAS domain S-box-containing protein
MAAKDKSLTGNERTFHPDEIVVTKTDLQGRITYANDVFIKLAGYSEAELLGTQHNIIRHPHMPRCVFKLLWDTIQGGNEIFAYVINRADNGDHYWVYAHVTPSIAEGGKVMGYHSSRRVANKGILTNTIIPLYGKLLDLEKSHGSAKEGLEASARMLADTPGSLGFATYEELIHSLFDGS